MSFRYTGEDLAGRVVNGEREGVLTKLKVKIECPSYERMSILLVGG